MSEYLTCKQVSEKYNIPLPTIYYKICKKQIPFIRISKRLVRFHAGRIDEWVNRDRCEPIESEASNG